MLHIWKKNDKRTKYCERRKGSDLTQEDIDFITDNYYELGRKEITKKLNISNYTLANVVLNIRKKGGLSKRKTEGVTDKERAFIRDNAGKMSASKIAEKLGRHHQVVTRYLEKLESSGVQVVKDRWKDKVKKELDYVLNNYYEKTAKEMAEELDVPLHIVVGRVNMLRDAGLLLERKKRRLSCEDVKYIIDNKDRLTACEIAREIGVSKDTVYRRIKKLDADK